MTDCGESVQMHSDRSFICSDSGSWDPRGASGLTPVIVLVSVDFLHSQCSQRTESPSFSTDQDKFQAQLSLALLGARSDC